MNELTERNKKRLIKKLHQTKMLSAFTFYLEIFFAKIVAVAFDLMRK